MKRVAIVGGGLSGLSAAYQLPRYARVEFTLFEASARLGGIVETVRKDGFVIECGPDAWVTEKPWARELAVELGLEEEILPSNDAQRRTYLLKKGELIAMPDGMRMMVPAELDPVMESPLFSDAVKLAYQREPERADELKMSALKENDESVASFVRRHFGDEVARTVAGPLLSGVFGGDVETLSVRAVMPAFVKMEREYGSLIRALQARATATEGAVFTTLRSGLGTLIDRIVSTLPEKSVRLADPVIAVTRRDEGWRIRTADAELSFDAVIVATPAHVTRQVLKGVDDRFAELLAMEATSAIVVALAFSAGQAHGMRIPRGFGFLVPEQGGEESQLLACTFVDQKFLHRVPESGALLRAFFGGSTAERLLHETDEALTALALRRVSEVFGTLPPPHLAVVRRWPRSLPQYAVRHLERMAQLEKLVARCPGLHLVGNAYYGVGLPDMVRMGRQASRQIMKE